MKETFNKKNKVICYVPNVWEYVILCFQINRTGLGLAMEGYQSHDKRLIWSVKVVGYLNFEKFYVHKTWKNV